MLRMGFVDEVEAILSHTPKEKQVALFSATMPKPIRKIADRHLRDPIAIDIKSKSATVSTVRQRFCQVTARHKLDALTRVLEVEDFDGMVIFVRTKTATVELAEKLEARGFSSGALNGDMNQALRERTIDRLKRGLVDIVVATDVAARGLDVSRISHVLNYDIPYDTEAYIHRIGRTARAGRSGEAIIFVAPRETRMLRSIEKATGKTIEPMALPSETDIADRRTGEFKNLITATIEAQDLAAFEGIIAAYQQQHDADLGEIAAALAYLVQRERPLAPRLAPIPEQHSRSVSAVMVVVIVIVAVIMVARAVATRAQAKRAWCVTGSPSAVSMPWNRNISLVRSRTRSDSTARTSDASNCSTATVRWNSRKACRVICSSTCATCASAGNACA